ncbi:MAG: sigma factor [Flavobacteriales bacterium]
MRSHDSKAVEAVYRLCRAGVFSYVKQNSGNQDDAKDVLQDAIMATYLKVTQDGFELTSALNTFIQGIARNLWLKHLDRYKKRYIPDNRI